MRTFLAITLLAALPFQAAADGFRLKDFRKISVDPSVYSKGQFGAKQEKTRLTIGCLDCSGATAIDVILGQSTDGTEDRYRSGQTTLRQMEDNCKSRAPECRLRDLKVGGAVGWVSTYNLGKAKGSTAILFQDGDMLTIRSISPRSKTTKDNMSAALRNVAAQIVGPKR